MTVLVTGCSGFVGRYLLQNLMDDNVQVLGVSSTQSPSKNVIASNYTASELARAFEGASAVVHLAASRPYTGNSSYASNLELDEKVFQAAYQAGVSNLIFASTRGIYGSVPTPWHEELVPKPINSYAEAKFESELLAHAYNRKGMRIKILRLAQLMGVGEQEQSVIPTFLRNCVNHKPVIVTVSGVEREYIYVKDVVQACRKAIQKPNVSGVFNVGSGQVSNLEEIAYKICEIADKPQLLSIQIAKTLNEYSLMDSSKFISVFDWTPKYTLDMAIKEMLDMMQTGNK